jgi:ATP-dependent Clp protease protease subunit
MDTIDAKRKVLLLNDGIDDDSLGLVHTALLEFGGKPCRIVMNSGGGSVVSGLGIIDLIRSYPGKVTIDVVGAAESMAAVILQAADVRRMHASSFLMIHQGIEEPEADSKRNIKSYLKMSDRNDDLCDDLVLKRIQKKHPKYGWAQFRAETENNQYFTAEQALEWNLVDRIIRAKVFKKSTDK